MNINDIEHFSLLIGSKSLHFTYIRLSKNLSVFLF